MNQVIENTHRIACGVPAVFLIIGIGLYLSIKTRFAQVRYFPRACRHFYNQFFGRDQNREGVSSHQALCTALAATVGTGNMAGVAGAIALGGPGAVFWMWVSAFMGMIVKMAEIVLSVRYRSENENGEYVGGTMYMIQCVFGKRCRWLAISYCVFGVAASFGIGNAAQINTVVTSLHNAVSTYGAHGSLLWDCTVGVALAIPIAIILSGGVRRVGEIMERFVPVAAAFYLILCIGVLLLRRQMIMSALAAILNGAFSPAAVTGGVVGSVFQVLKIGSIRGVFTNEAGLGTAAMAHTAAQVDDPVDQGLLGIVEVFIDTIVICTMTALVILCCDVTICYGADVGMSLVNDAFSSVYGDWINVPITISICLFAVAAVIGWGVYGGRCLQFLFGKKAWKVYVLVQVLVVVFSACIKTETIWKLAEIMNGLMAVPNLIVLCVLSSELVQLTCGGRKQIKIKHGSRLILP